MYSFQNDYSETCHPSILKAIEEISKNQHSGYGLDLVTKNAATLIKDKLKNNDADIHFVSAGTQANMLCLSAFLRPYESVISATTGHINIHECGAIEFSGHKINGIITNDGKLTPELINPLLLEHKDEHLVMPKIVYISNTTELGTVYSKSEIKKLSDFCKDNNLYLYMDGARLGSALVSDECDLKFEDLSELIDAFYIGGTKNGAMFGEVIVINNPKLKENFRYHMKQKGALLAKGFMLGVQFQELFKGDLYLELARHANECARVLSDGFKDKGYKMLYPLSSNQIFPILTKRKIEELKKNFLFYEWQSVSNATENKDNLIAIRLVTSWATEVKKVKEFLTYI